MWDGVLGFVWKIKSGDYFLWIGQFNEHRIFLSRIIFWLDYSIFGDLNILSIIANYVLTGIGVFVFVLYVKEIDENKKLSKGEFSIVVSLIISWEFLWTQSENLFWAFQSQFILAQLLPLMSLFFMAKFVKEFSVRFYVISCFVAILSLGSMANGILVFPLLFLYALIMKINRVKCVILLCCAILFPLLYFVDYHAPDGHAHFFESLMGHPRQFLCYVLMYLGNPFHYLLGKGAGGHVVAILAGGIFISVLILTIYRQALLKSRSAFVVALLFFALYVGASAIGTAGGRLALGLQQALSSRYTTPVIMAWLALVISVSVTFSFENENVRRPLRWGCAVLLILMVSFQVKALRSEEPTAFLRKQAALSLALGVNDVDYIHVLYPDADRAMMLANQALHYGISVYSREPFSGARKNIGHETSLSNKQRCVGFVDHVYMINNAPDYLRLDGWIYSPSSSSVPEYIEISNENKIVAGYAVVGMPRDDVAVKFGKSARLSGFGGYVKKSLLTAAMSGIGINPGCQFYLK
ncbi:hypothetical protein VI06_10150 [Aquitalea magnusonii]|nr:hypothetical protein VI06_10150 [Aquitalea magnusonii]